VVLGHVGLFPHGSLLIPHGLWDIGNGAVPAAPVVQCRVSLGLNPAFSIQFSSCLTLVDPAAGSAWPVKYWSASI
jgi:hypothetical protein